MDYAQRAEDQLMHSRQSLGYAGSTSPHNVAAPANAPLCERLVSFVQHTKQAESLLAAARERLCGPWPQPAQASNASNAGQVESLLDTLQAVLADVFDHAAALNSRI